MRRQVLAALAAGLWLPAIVASAAEPGAPGQLSLSAQMQAIPARAVSGPSQLPRHEVPVRRMAASTDNSPMPIEATTAGPQVPVQQPGYVQLNSSMYPAPQPNVPYWTGVTMITNQALAPHEMLYPHTYKAVYPPYYHRVKGCWIVTPFGVKSHERWELQGTQVQVKYRSSVPLRAHFHPPMTSMWGGPWK